MLAAGALLTLALAAAHYFSPLSRRLAAGQDVELVLLNKERPMLFFYHPFSRTVNAVRLPGRFFAGRGAGGSAYQRACAVLRLFSKSGIPEREAPIYIEVLTPDLDGFEDLLNNWRARPARLVALLRGLRDLKRGEATNLSVHDIFLIALELSNLNSANFIKEDFDDARAAEPPRAVSSPDIPPGRPITRVEVLNASGRKDLAALVTKYLREKGFDVITFGTYGSDEKRTKIVNCSGNVEAARRIRDALGLGGLEIYSKFDKLGISQARIILGTDFDESKIK